MRNSHAPNLVCQIFPKVVPIIEKFHVTPQDSPENRATGVGLLQW